MLLAVLQRAEIGWDPLVARAAAGDAKARRELTDAAIARVCGLAGAMGARGRDLEELAQSVLEETFLGLGVLRGELPSPLVLDRVAAATILARVDRWPALAAAEHDEGTRPSLEHVSARLQSIEPRRRLTLVLSVMGRSVEEVAEVLDCTPSAAASRIDPARRSLAAVCPRFEEALLEAPVDEGAGLDALAERRVLRATIAAMDRAPTIGSIPPPPPARRWGWAALGAGAVAIFAVLALVVLWPAGPGPARPRMDSIVVLCSGDVSAGGTPARAGQWVGAGAAFRLGPDSRLALGLGDGSGVWVGEGAGGLLEAWSTARARVRLDRGTLVARVEPRAGRLFEVRTGTTVARTGRAVFSVTAGPAWAVRVLQGTVQVDGRRVGSGQQLGAGARAASPAEAAALAYDREHVGAGRLRVDGARIRVDSTPAGALVTLAGQTIGRTPVSWVAPAGDARLTVLLDGWAPVVEELSLRADDRLDRRFALVPQRSAAADELPSWARPVEEAR